MAYDERFLREAIRLSMDGARSADGGPFGAVVTRNGRVVGRGRNLVASAKDPTAHAEVVAIRAACSALGSFSLSGCEIYASCEPCPMCLSAIYWARLDALHFAASREDAAAAGFDDAFLYEEVGKSPETRALPSEQRLREAAQAAFRQWADNPRRTEY